MLLRVATHTVHDAPRPMFSPIVSSDRHRFAVLDSSVAAMARSGRGLPFTPAALRVFKLCERAMNALLWEEVPPRPGHVGDTVNRVGVFFWTGAGTVALCSVL